MRAGTLRRREATEGANTPYSAPSWSVGALGRTFGVPACSAWGCGRHSEHHPWRKRSLTVMRGTHRAPALAWRMATVMPFAVRSAWPRLGGATTQSAQDQGRWAPLHRDAWHLGGGPLSWGVARRSDEPADVRFVPVRSGAPRQASLAWHPPAAPRRASLAWYMARSDLAVRARRQCLWR